MHQSSPDDPNSERSRGDRIMLVSSLVARACKKESSILRRALRLLYSATHWSLVEAGKQ